MQRRVLRSRGCVLRIGNCCERQEDNQHDVCQIYEIVIELKPDYASEDPQYTIKARAKR